MSSSFDELHHWKGVYRADERPPVPVVRAGTVRNREDNGPHAGKFIETHETGTHGRMNALPSRYSANRSVTE